MTDEELQQELGSELSELEKLVFEAIGEASMCWHKRPTSDFDDQKALDVSHKLIAAIRELYKV